MNSLVGKTIVSIEYEGSGYNDGYGNEICLSIELVFTDGTTATLKSEVYEKYFSNPSGISVEISSEKLTANS